MSLFAQTPKPPYYAVIFTSILEDTNTDDYQKMSQAMSDLAIKQDGFLGLESAREQLGITVSYWKDLESIQKWKMNISHLHAQKLGKEKWYEYYQIRIAKVEREYAKDLTTP